MDDKETMNMQETTSQHTSRGIGSPGPRQWTTASRSIVGALVCLCACGAAAQTFYGTMTTIILPSDIPEDEALSKFELGHRQMGLTEAQIESGRERTRGELTRLLAGIQANGPFEYSVDGDSTFMAYVHPSPIEGAQQYHGTESFASNVTISQGPTGTVVRPGDHREHPAALWRTSFCGGSPAGAEVLSDRHTVEGHEVVYQWVRDDILHRMTVVYTDDSRTEVRALDFGYATPEQFVRPGVAAYTRAATAHWSSDRRTLEMDIYAGERKTEELRFEISSHGDKGEVVLGKGVERGSTVTDLRLGESAPVNYVWNGVLPDVDSLGMSPRRNATSPYGGPALVLGGLVAVTLGVWLYRR
ncbi:MAG: hypothetical protein AB7T05_02795 [Fimbriimonadaceae bacterium]